ncbi:hypothetical protein QQ054_30815 [Oscillatoria amoena NRMC-F 0135]|uniref:Uroporphyrinogen decarboxylase (URO-D) domain-containing protein n=1 Tax=Geitlerinema calcuttense NRMC-F 0142 TaxID=2922238 RepID=A0ABT7M260_9CYAN|nr:MULTISPECIES: hypothetical protein [Cyanophyceae]MDL5050397.1 hypothetical protein [Oscillatoria amoena NRMC-F 0135]MDL5054206.1 hypothetical protein [Oscillatoria laete-virens NRMC-F 0139]MDL5057455.1 hypothetical protein [Geitlerinema calcuttense NRMC-F 0142]
MPQNDSVKSDESRTRQIMDAFWQGESYGRPALLVKARNGRYSEENPEIPAPQRRAYDLDPEYHARLVRYWTRSKVYLAEAMPGHQLTWGSCLATLPVIAGGDYDYHDSAWIKPMPDILDRPLPVFDPGKEIIKRLETCYRAGMEAVRGEGFLSAPVMIDGLTTLSLFMGVEELCLGLREKPDIIRNGSAALNALFSDIYDHFHGFLKNQCGGNGDSVCFFGPLYPGKSESVQCDFAVMLSPKDFEQFVIPDLHLTTSRLDSSLYHMDGTGQLRFLDLLATVPALTGIQWNPEIEAAKRPMEWISAFKRIRSKGLCLYLHLSSAEEVIAITREIGPDGLCVRLPDYDTEKDAHEAIAKIEKVFPLSLP